MSTSTIPAPCEQGPDAVSATGAQVPPDVAGHTFHIASARHGEAVANVTQARQRADTAQEALRQAEAEAEQARIDLEAAGRDLQHTRQAA